MNTRKKTKGARTAASGCLKRDMGIPQGVDGDPDLAEPDHPSRGRQNMAALEHNCRPGSQQFQVQARRAAKVGGPEADIPPTPFSHGRRVTAAPETFGHGPPSPEAANHCFIVADVVSAPVMPRLPPESTSEAYLPIRCGHRTGAGRISEWVGLVVLTPVADNGAREHVLQAHTAGDEKCRLGIESAANRAAWRAAKRTASWRVGKQCSSPVGSAMRHASLSGARKGMSMTSNMNSGSRTDTSIMPNA